MAIKLQIQGTYKTVSNILETGARSKIKQRIANRLVCTKKAMIKKNQAHFLFKKKASNKDKL